MTRLQRHRVVLIDLAILAALATAVGLPTALWYVFGPRGWDHLVVLLTLCCIPIVPGLLGLGRLRRLHRLRRETDSN